MVQPLHQPHRQFRFTRFEIAEVGPDGRIGERGDPSFPGAHAQELHESSIARFGSIFHLRIKITCVIIGRHALKRCAAHHCERAAVFRIQRTGDSEIHIGHALQNRMRNQRQVVMFFKD